jgi:hypothetical protein
MLNDDPVHQRMLALIQEWEQAHDRRSIFLSCYAMMTENMLTAIQSGEFHDPAWVDALLHHFAGYYFTALDAYESQPADSPQVWQLAFDAARQPRTYVLQNLLLGINAHINYDLVLAVSDQLRPEWDALSPEQRQQRYQDHRRVNEVIAQTVDAVQDQVVERYSKDLEIIDVLLGPLDEWVASAMISEWRENVWEHAVRMVELQDDAEREQLRQAVEIKAHRFGEHILLRVDHEDAG